MITDDGAPSTADAQSDPFQNDPFFKLIPDAQWNACIGRQGDEESYIDGYIEAAVEIANSVLSNRLQAQRDTLILPVLYNARHSIELVLKHSIRELSGAKVIKPYAGKLETHDIKAYWQHLSTSAIGDQGLVNAIESLAPFVESLAGVDDDGQELRYHLNRNQDPSLHGYSLANFSHVAHSLSILKPLISTIVSCTRRLIAERNLGTCTATCSRTDLISIAKLLPPRAEWITALTDELIKRVRENFSLSSRTFSEALTAIQGNAEMRALIGLETNLDHISDEDVQFFVMQWQKLHPPLQSTGGIVEYFSFRDRERMFDSLDEDRRIRDEIVPLIQQRLSREAIIELEAIFQLGRDSLFPEYHKKLVERELRGFDASGPGTSIDRLLNKTNLLQSFRKALPRLGRLKLANDLGAL